MSANGTKRTLIASVVSSLSDGALLCVAFGRIGLLLNADDVNVVIEVPIGGEPIKYEMDKAAGTLVVDRFLHTPMRYPGNYGFVPHTLSRDGDPIDVLVANTRSIFPGAVINVRPIGVLKMQDEGGILAETVTRSSCFAGY
jgi:inorganic pyrophosphatase